MPIFGPRTRPRETPQDPLDPRRPWGGSWRPPAPDVTPLPRSVPAREVGIRAVSSVLGQSLAQGVRISEARAAEAAPRPSRTPYNSDFGYNPAGPYHRTTENASIPGAPGFPWVWVALAGGALWLLGK